MQCAISKQLTAVVGSKVAVVPYHVKPEYLETLVTWFVHSRSWLALDHVILHVMNNLDACMLITHVGSYY